MTQINFSLIQMYVVIVNVSFVQTRQEQYDLQCELKPNAQMVQH